MKEIKTIGVIGAGQMGSGIAQVCAQAGYKTLLFDVNSEAAQSALDKIGAAIKKLVSKEKISEEQAKQTLENLSVPNTLDDFQSCDLAIEAIVENTDVKISLFQDLDKIVSKDAILASNTSSISITKMASAVENPERFIGIHFMNPVPIMKLVEIIKAEQTSDEIYQAAKSLVESLGKVSVLGIDSPGFIINRILCPMVNEAIHLHSEGVSKEDIDTGMKLGTNQPMGPLELADFVGLDTLHSILSIMEKEFGDEKYKPCDLLTKYVQEGRLGKKVGRGFYEY